MLSAPPYLMFVEEALWIRNTVAELNLPSHANIIDVGASDLFVRTRLQPHIHNFIYQPLQERGMRIAACDQKEGLGVDHVIDICNKTLTPKNVIGAQFDLVLCCNMLEHVVDRSVAMYNVVSLVRPGGFLLATVPYEYFYHEDPIDTMYRPSTEELQTLIARFAEGEVINKHVLSISDRQYYVMPVYPNVLWHNIPFIAYRNLWRWLIKSSRWKVSCVLVRVNQHKSQGPT